MSNIIQTLEAERITRKVPDFKPGDTVVVQVKVVEGEREKLDSSLGGIADPVRDRSIPRCPRPRASGNRSAARHPVAGSDATAVARHARQPIARPARHVIPHRSRRGAAWWVRRRKLGIQLPSP